jgi:hypothetical protein
MTWFKVDDGLHSHPKAFRAGTAALGLWVRAGSWSASQLTDGFVPDDVVRMYGTPSMAKALVAAELWTKTEGGYQFHQWSDEGRQPTRDKVLAEKAASRDRVRRYRDRRNGPRNGGGNAVTETDIDDQNRSRNDNNASHVGEKLSGSEGSPSVNDPRRAAGEAPRTGVGNAVSTTPPTRPVPSTSVPSERAPRRRRIEPEPPDAPNAGTVVAAWVEACEANEVRPSAGQRSQVGRLAKELLDAGNDPDRVLAAARAAAAKGFATIDRELTAMAGRRPAAAGLEAPAEDDTPVYWRPENTVAAMIERGE